MKADKLLLELEEVVLSMGFKIRKEKGPFRSDACVLSGENIVMLNKSLPPEIQNNVLAKLIAERGGEDVFIKPVVRKELETLWRNQKTAQADIDFNE